jgi:inner membrane protein
VAIAPLLQVQHSYPNADIFLSGEVAIDFSAIGQDRDRSNQMVIVSISGNSIKFSYCCLLRYE